MTIITCLCLLTRSVGNNGYSRFGNDGYFDRRDRSGIFESQREQRLVEWPGERLQQNSAEEWGAQRILAPEPVAYQSQSRGLAAPSGKVPMFYAKTTIAFYAGP